MSWPAPLELRRLSPSQRIFLMPAVAAVTLSILFLLNLNESRHEKALLSRIVDADIPALELTKSLVQSLERFQRELQDAVAAADVNGLTAADAIGRDMSAQIGKGRKDGTLDAAELADIDRDLTRHCILARATALAMIERRPGIDLTPALERMTKGYNELRTRLETLSTRTRTEMSAAFETARARQRAHASAVGALSLVCLVLLAGLSLVVGRAQERIASHAVKSQALLEKAQRAAHVGSWELDLVRNEVAWSDELYRILGLESQGHEPSRERFFESLDPEDREMVEAKCLQAIRSGEPCSLAFRVVRPDGESRAIYAEGTVERDVQGKSTRFFATCQDVTERRSLEEKLRQGQKMEAVGRLAGGVAHDFNNLLTVIQGYTGLLQDSLELSPPGAARDDNSESVEQIRLASDRAASLTQQLLAFSRQQVLQPKVLNLNTVVANLVPMLRRLIGEDIALGTSLDPGLPPVLADAGQIEQVIMNLAVNARDAMPQGGKLEIETRATEASEGEPSLRPDSRPGRYVALAVKDTGVGMSPDVKAKVFEPFFTTKGIGKGTGLGLATVHGIVQQSGGFVRLESELGHGTTFRIYLPSVEAEVVPAASLVDSAAGRPLTSSWTILLIEDEKALQKLLGSVLEGHGYSVLTASNGAEALEAAKKHDGPIHLILSDVVMPGVGGPRVVSEIQESRPEAEAIFMSGYADDSVVRHGLSESDVHFLQKPFTPSALLKKVQKVLEGRETTGA